MKTIITILLFIPIFSFGQITTYYLNQDSLPSDTIFSHQLLDMTKNFISDNPQVTYWNNWSKAYTWTDGQDPIFADYNITEEKIKRLQDQVNELKFQVQELAILLREQLAKQTIINPK